jgi:hypothetical protein
MDNPSPEEMVGEFLKDLWEWETDQALELGKPVVALESDQVEIARTVRRMED